MVPPCSLHPLRRTLSDCSFSNLHATLQILQRMVPRPALAQGIQQKAKNAPTYACSTLNIPCRLAELGFTKLFNEIDMKEAARQGLLGLGSKPLDTEHIQGFLEDFGLDAEFGVHSRIRGLSGAWPILPVQDSSTLKASMSPAPKPSFHAFALTPRLVPFADTRRQLL